MAGDLSLNFRPRGNNGKGFLVAKVADKAIHTAKLDLTDPDQRFEFAATVCSECPGINQESLLQELKDQAAQYAESDGNPSGKSSQTQALIELAAHAELFHDGDKAYATIEVADAEPNPEAPVGPQPRRVHQETHAIKGQSFRSWLSSQFWQTQQNPPASPALRDAVDLLDSTARITGSQQPVFVRIAHHQGAIYLDLANAQWQVVKITAEGWEVISDPPVKFIRREGMLPLPAPVRRGSLRELRPLINAAEDPLWCLMVAWLVGTFSPGPYPVLIVNGEQGSAKTTLSRMLRGLVDPNAADLRAAPQNERDLIIAASNAHFMAFDNLSSISAELSDSLCRLATGGGFATRKLFSDDEEKLFNAKRPILLNGIGDLATRPDLLERAIILTLEAIPDQARQTESALWRQYEQARPRILGALLDAVATALRNRSSVQLAQRPRMADFTEWVLAAEPALPWRRGTFQQAYRENREAANELALEASPVGQAILGLMRNATRWEGTATALLAKLRQGGLTDCPKAAQALSNALRRIAPTLRRLGIETCFWRKAGGMRDRMIHLQWIEETSSPPSPSVPPPDLLSQGQAEPSGPMQNHPKSLFVPQRPADGPTPSESRDDRDDRDDETGEGAMEL